MELRPPVEDPNGLDRLSVFAGGWTLDAAEAVCSGDGIRKEAMLDLLSHLLEKSLVNTEQDATGSQRYRFLETVRQYGRERLLRSGTVQKLRDRHLAFFFEFARRAEPELHGPDQVHWLKQVEPEHDNLGLALEWSLTTGGQTETPLRLVCALWAFWSRHNHFAEGRQSVERALSANPDAPASLRARALVAAAELSFFLGDYAADEAFARQIIALDLRELDEERWTIAFAYFALANLATNRGAFEEGVTLAEKSLAIAHETGTAWVGGLTRIPLVLTAIERGALQRARLLIEESVEIFRSSGDKWGLAIVLVNLSHVMVCCGEFEQAIVAAREGLMLSQETADRRNLTWCPMELGVAMTARKEASRAVRLWGAVESISQSIGSPLPSSFLAIRDLHLPTARQSLGNEAFAAAWAEGQQMTPDAAVAYALREPE